MPIELNNELLYSFQDYAWLYGVFCIFVLAMLALDLGVFNRKTHVISIKEATVWSLVWVSLALLFSVGLYFVSAHLFAQNPRLTSLPGFDPHLAAQRATLEFLTGYVIEKSLAVDNIFVFVVVFSFFSIPSIYQHRVLFYGIIGALIFRGLFIGVGSVLMQYHTFVWIFGAFLVLTGIKLIFTAEKPVSLEQNRVLKLINKVLPVTKTLHEGHFFVKENGKWLLTPLMLALIFIEFTDIIFAFDSVPAIFAITREPFLVFTSNIFAIMGLRSLYFMLASVVDKFHYLKYGLAVVLIFVGMKMLWLNEAFDGKFPITWSLAIIAGVIGTSILASFVIKAKDDTNLS